MGRGVATADRGDYDNDMSRAKTVGEAAFGAFSTYKRDVWQEGDVPISARDAYVERGQPVASDTLPPIRPAQQMRRHLLRSADRQRLLVHGQIGTGKSMELHHLLGDQQIRERLEVVRLSLVDRLNLSAPVNIRLVLVAMAQAVARHLVFAHGAKVGNVGFNWSKDRQAVLAEWLRILNPDDAFSGPDKVQDEPIVVTLSASLVSKTVQIQSDAAVRAQLATDAQFAPDRLRRLVEELLKALHEDAVRPVLFVIDDGDKMGDLASARDVFIDNLRLLLGLPAHIILTVPFWLHFDPEFLAASQGTNRTAIANAKVVSRQDPHTLLEPGRRFFWAVYDKLAERALIDEAALELAARMSAGIPREFIRMLERGFDLADELGRDRLDLPTLNMALGTLRRDLFSFTQDAARRAALVAVHRTKALQGAEDWKLLNSLLVVEYTNERPWYDVHPLLVEDVALWSSQT